MLYTGEHLQLVLMTLKAGEEIGEDAISRFADLWPQLERELAAAGAAQAGTGPGAA